MLRIFDKYDNAGRNGYTLAEMLLVLVIVGLVMAALPRATKKLFHVTTKSGDNGRLECFWDDSGEGAPVLTKYYATSGGTTMTCRDKEGEECAATHFANVPNPDGGADLRACVFQPPKNPVYLSLHAVGGGGSGAWPMIDRDGSGTYYTTPTSEVYSQDLIDGSSRDLSTVEEWWKTLRNDANKGSHPTFNNVAPYTDDEKRGHDWDALKQMFNEYTYSTDDGTFTRDGEDEAKNKKYNVYTKTIWNRYLLRYANAGKAGQVVSMYFPQVPGNSRLLVVPGRGGSVSESLNSSSDGNDFNGVAGTDTVVFMDNNSSGTPEVLMRASGGSSGISAKLGSNGDIYLQT